MDSSIRTVFGQLISALMAVKHLISSGFDVTITSRDIKKAQNLADSFEASIKVEPYSKLEELLEIMPVLS